MTTVTATDFKSFADSFISSVKDTGKTAQDFLDEATSIFPVTKAAIMKRFKSYFKKTISEAIETQIMPSREELKLAILQSESVNILWEKLGLNYYRRKGLFDKYFNVSNFEKAKAVCMMETFEVPHFNPTIDENLSLVCSQMLGDGSYNKQRGAISITHGEKQMAYGVWKASLFNKAFPETKPSGNTKFCTHPQGHKYSNWFSGRLPTKVTKFIENNPPEAWIEELTPFGIMLYCLDDAYINLDLTQRSNTYLTIHVPHGEKAVEKLQEVFRSYGIGTTVSGGKNLKIGTVAGAVMFYKNFIEPFKDEIPSCMHYKTELKI